MATGCIPPNVAASLKAYFAKNPSMTKFRSMSSAERLAFMEKGLPRDMAIKVVGDFERALLKKQTAALDAWKDKSFGNKTGSPEYNNLSRKLAELQKNGVINPYDAKDFLSTLVESRLGMEVTPAEFNEISKRSADLETTFQKKDKFGNPELEYWIKRNEMDKYIQSLTPTSKARVAFSTIRRGAMLATIKSPIVNIISNTVMGSMTAAERRIFLGALRGESADLAREYKTKVWEIYKASGYDISRMSGDWTDVRIRGENITHSQGPGATRAAGRFFEDTVFKYSMGGPDVLASAHAFADYADLASTQLAKGIGRQRGYGEAQTRQLARKIFMEATQLKDRSEYSLEARTVRDQAIADARYSTYTNKGWLADAAMGFREALNKVNPDLALGDQLMPFVKTPANVIQAAIDYSQLGFAKCLVNLPKASAQAQQGNMEPMRQLFRDFAKAGFGSVMAAALVYMTKPDDFVGAYDTLSSRQKAFRGMKNAPVNAVRLPMLGNRWVSLDYFGPLAAEYTGLMYARKYGKNIPDKILQSFRGAGAQIISVPGLRALADLYSGVKEATAPGTTFKSTAEGAVNSATDYARSVIIPGGLYDIALATDPYLRKTSRGMVSKFKAGIPGLRETLPPATGATTGQPLHAEPWYLQMLFGSRVKRAETDDVVQELSRLEEVGAKPAVGSIEFGERMKKFRTQTTEEKFNQAVSHFQSTYGARARNAMTSSVYIQSENEDKAKILNELRDKILDETLRTYGYKKPEKKGPGGIKAVRYLGATPSGSGKPKNPYKKSHSGNQYKNPYK